MSSPLLLCLRAAEGHTITVVVQICGPSPDTETTKNKQGQQNTLARPLFTVLVVLIVVQHTEESTE